MSSASDGRANVTSPMARQKKLRGKYTSRACVQCRQRKLKCCGEEPCQRCIRHGQDCIFYDDRRRVEALVEKNRLNISEHNTSPSSAISERYGGPEASRRSMTIESRIERIETMMETLLSMQPGMSVEPSSRASAEPEQIGRNGMDYQGDTAFEAPIEALNVNLASIKDQLNLSKSGNTHSRPLMSAGGSHYIPTASPSRSVQEPTSTIRVGARDLPFPGEIQYAKYIDFFFDDINPCHSVVNESEFRTRSKKLLAGKSVDRSDICFLSLNYIIFASSDLLVEITPAMEKNCLPGWQWFLVANELVGKRKISGRGDLSLIQFLMFEAIYLTHADKPNAAYNVAGLACRLCFQFGLHQQSCWGADCSGYSAHMRQRLFWTVYFVDRRISLSCGRPYGMRDLDINVDLPIWIDDKELHSNQPLPAPNPNNSANAYLSCMVIFGRFAGEVWDQVFSAGASSNGDGTEVINTIDAKIKHWQENILPTIPLLPVRGLPSKTQLRQQNLVHTRISHLRLLLRRRMMISLAYDGITGALCGSIAVNIVSRLKVHDLEASQPSSFRFHMSTTLGGAILILATLLTRPLSTVSLQDKQPIYAETFRDAVKMLREISTNLQAARRIAKDLEDIIDVVTSILDQPQPLAPQRGFMNYIPANMENLFPYGNVDFTEQTIVTEGQPGDFSNAAGGSMFQYDVMTSLDSWDYDMQPTANGYGVVWI